MRAPCESFWKVPPGCLQDRKGVGDGGKIKWKFSEVNTRAVSREQDELIGKFTLSWNVPINSSCPGIIPSDNFHLIFPPFLLLLVSQPPRWHFSKTLTWCRYYCVFTYIYSLLIEKGICDHQNMSLKLLCVCVWLSSRDLFTLSFPIFCVIHTLVLSFPHGL